MTSCCPCRIVSIGACSEPGMWPMANSASPRTSTTRIKSLRLVAAIKSAIEMRGMRGASAAPAGFPDASPAKMETGCAESALTVKPSADDSASTAAARANSERKAVFCERLATVQFKRRFCYKSRLWFCSRRSVRRTINAERYVEILLLNICLHSKMAKRRALRIRPLELDRKPARTFAQPVHDKIERQVVGRRVGIDNIEHLQFAGCGSRQHRGVSVHDARGIHLRDKNHRFAGQIR